MTARFFLQDCGIVAPIGRGKRAVAAALARGQRGLRRHHEVDTWVGAVDDDLPVLPASLDAFDCRNNRLMAVALEEIAASVEAAAQRFGRHRVAVVLGTSTSGISDGEEAVIAHHTTGAWPKGFSYSKQETGGLAEFAARYLGLSGPAYTVATACSSSAKVFASGRRLIRAGLADAVVVGGADTLCRMTIGGFGALESLSTTLCNPFSANRDGINIGEGAAAFLMSCEPGPVELLGVGETSDAHHPTAPDPTGGGARAAMEQALADAGMNATEIAYVNLHGTATPLNDAMEGLAVAGLFGSIPCSSTKGMTGHMLGGTGGCEAAFLWLTLNPETTSGQLPPHIWDGASDPAMPALNLVATGTPTPDGKLAFLSNSFGFGGSNAALILGRAA